MLKEKALLDATLDAIREAEEVARVTLWKSKSYGRKSAAQVARERQDRRWAEIRRRARPVFQAVDPQELARSFYLEPPRTPPGGHEALGRGAGASDKVRK